MKLQQIQPALIALIATVDCSEQCLAGELRELHHIELNPQIITITHSVIALLFKLLH